MGLQSILLGAVVFICGVPFDCSCIVVDVLYFSHTMIRYRIGGNSRVMRILEYMTVPAKGNPEFV